ncbi:hypothetical protein OH76DRAFT_1406427 [Lentinus brumalis]|uniref:Uncharacterized protein n=1 Tax=Lentinus brumalis TaxID=2498619 RepID=A0A371D3J2_9APHY|nr:hypothetical protein OH76DRAFT_1406427 [Polyporus brumalis]
MYSHHHEQADVCVSQPCPTAAIKYSRDLCKSQQTSALSCYDLGLAVAVGLHVRLPCVPPKRVR